MATAVPFAERATLTPKKTPLAPVIGAPRGVQMPLLVHTNTSIASPPEELPTASTLPSEDKETLWPK